MSISCPAITTKTLSISEDYIFATANKRNKKVLDLDLYCFVFAYGILQMCPKFHVWPILQRMWLFLHMIRLLEHY